ncbi:hypothetical protein L1049_011718 [Liquidambar formosana]|uniref:CDP-diacylglycerol--glycerol-3-phosphate 3-phosphatidyltransferase n=1 Tax=Liquidambar formosana TaxID=63359 RepID=A0AAP0RX59_LIQFO
MPGLKLTLAASLYGNPYKWVRTLASPTPVTMPKARASSSLLALNSNGERISAGWKITPCAPSLQDKGRALGFGGHKSFSSSASSSSFLHTPPKSSPSENRGEGEEEEEVGRGSSGPVTDSIMGSEHDDDDGSAGGGGGWSQNHHYHRQQQQQQTPPPSSASPPLQQVTQHQHQQPLKLLTLPTILTLGRVAAVPLLVSTFYFDSWWGTTATTSIFIAAAITDWLDGYIARKMRLGTAFGAFLDPVADKVRPFFLMKFQITMSAVREWAASQNSKLLEAVAVNNLGKWKTATQMTALTILLATRDSSLAGTRDFSSFWCCFALHFSRACRVVISCVYEEDMESIAEVACLALGVCFPPIHESSLRVCYKGAWYLLVLLTISFCQLISIY